jgi:hypothetical protein
MVDDRTGFMAGRQKKPDDARRAGFKRREIRKINFNNVFVGDWLTTSSRKSGMNQTE